MNSTNNVKLKYRHEIDGIRAFAVIAVIINHFNKEILPGGYLGVDIFFVISGYVITSSLSSKRSKGLYDFLKNFYTRRIKRIVPALLFFTLIVTPIFLLFNTYHPDLSLRTGISSLFGLSNMYLLRQSTDYFAESNELNPFTHTWSLGVEEQFYLIFPLIFWFTGFIRNSKNGAATLIKVLTILSAISLFLFLYLYQRNQSAAYFLMPTRFWELASGSIVFILINFYSRLIKKIYSFSPIILFGGIFTLMVISSYSPALSTFGVVLFTCLLLISLVQKGSLYKLLTNKFILFIGSISYSLYLWHWGILSLSRWSTGIYWWTIPWQFLLIITLSIISYFLIENPSRRKIWTKNNDANTLIVGVGITSLTSFILIMFSTELFKTKYKFLGNRIFPPKYEKTKNIHDVMYCHLPSNIKTALIDCLMNPTSNSKGNIYLIGDSHASNHFPSIVSALEGDKEGRFKSLVEYGIIKSFTGDDKCDINIGAKSYCIVDSWQKYTNLFSNELKPGDLVLVSMARGRYVNVSNSYPRKINKDKLDHFRKKLLILNKIASDRGARIGLIDDIPLVCTSNNINWMFDIVTKGDLDKCLVKKEISLQDRIGITELYKDLSNKYNSIIYIDFHEELCFEEYCGLLDKNNKLLYGDESPHFEVNNPDPLKNEWKIILRNLGLI